MGSPRPKQLNSTSFSIKAVFPVPGFPASTTPLLVGRLDAKCSEISPYNHCRPTKMGLGSRWGTSKNKGFNTQWGWFTGEKCSFGSMSGCCWGCCCCWWVNCLALLLEFEIAEIFKKVQKKSWNHFSQEKFAKEWILMTQCALLISMTKINDFKIFDTEQGLLQW